MGMTIHYQGTARDDDALTELLKTAQLFAAQREWMFALFDNPFEIGEGGPDDRDIERDELPFRGIIIRPHPECEPVRLVFSRFHALAGFTKTQFAPFHVHVEIVRLLRAIEPFMDDFLVIDETTLWETGDEAAARERFERLSEAIDAFAAELEEPDNLGHGMFDDHDDESTEPWRNN
jgi:hypothetical protein